MSTKSFRLNVYGRRVDIERIEGEWIAFLRGTDGKRVRTPNLVIPADLERDQVVTYLADLLHESATEHNPDVEVLD